MKRTPLKRKSGIRKKKRSASEFARVYGSKARVQFVKALPCLICRATPCDNAHTGNGGMGRKSGYETIVPLCREHHSAFDEARWPFDDAAFRVSIKQLAQLTEKAWRRSRPRSPEEPK